MEISSLESALDELFDRELLFHGYTDYMRDYDLIIYESVDPRSGLHPRHRRFRFRYCTETYVTSRVRPDVWPRSMSDELLRLEQVTRGSLGFVWGVRCQILYPGAKIVPDSDRAKRWTEEVGIAFHEVQIEANAHALNLVFSDLVIDDIASGYEPFRVEEHGVAERYAEGSKIPLNPDP